MADLLLDPREQSALATLMASEPVPGDPMPPLDALEALRTLVPADILGAGLCDIRGHLLAERDLPHSWEPDFDESRAEAGHEGVPLYVGFMRWPLHPLQAEACQSLPGVDGITIGFRVGGDCVAQVYLDRRRREFTERETTLLRMVSPLLQRLVRERPTPRLPTGVTVQERRVLNHVAAGASNAEIAKALFIAPSTVRKHLEHVYAKLGVHGRLEALAVLRGSDAPDLDLLERVERYA